MSQTQDLLSVDAALQSVLEHTQPLPPREVHLTDALGLVLAEDIASDVDSPPHDQAQVDGYAVRSADVRGGQADLRVVQQITAGEVPAKPIGRREAARIMTGAPVPRGADAVVMFERTQASADASGAAKSVVLDDPKFSVGQNILRRAQNMRAGEVVLHAGTEIRAVEVGLLAEVGRVRLHAVPRPTVAVLCTGNELVSPEATPGEGQIRNSNGPMLAALVVHAGGMPIALGIARDDEDELRAMVASGLRADMLVLSGGVSAGVLDLVPKILAESGVRPVFHRVRLKPGKPLWFGMAEANDRPKPVFGLPGNPVSSLVCFELFVRPAMARLSGRTWTPRLFRAQLTTAHRHRGERPTYHPGVLRHQQAGNTVEPLAWQGSADLRTVTRANALICFPPGDRDYPAGESVDVRPLHGVWTFGN